MIEVAGQLVSVPVLVLLGLFAGVMAGMFGIGGGVFITPALNIVCGIPMPVAVSSSLCQQIGTSVGSFLKHRQLKSGEPWIDMYMLGGGLMGAHAGTRVLHWLESQGTWAPFGEPVPAVKIVLQLAYAVFILAVLVPTLHTAFARGPVRPVGERSNPDAPLRRLKLPPYVPLPNLRIRAMSMPVLAYVGFLGGFMSGMLGVGGGILILPILIHGMGISLKNVVGTGIIVLFANVVWGTTLHAWAGRIDLPLALSVLAGSSIGTQIGAKTAHRISAHALAGWFAALLTFVAGSILINLWFSLR